MAGPHFTWKPQAGWEQTVGYSSTGAAGANFTWMGKEVTAELNRLAGGGLRAAAIHATRRLKEVLSVPAPRRRVNRQIRKTGTTGTALVSVIAYVATKRATRGAPPRKLSGQLRRSITYQFVSSSEGEIARVGTNVVYGRYLEMARSRGDHQWLLKTILAIAPELMFIIGHTAGGGPSISRPMSES